MIDNNIGVQRKKVIMIPYAEIPVYSTGSNMEQSKNRVEVYMKNCSVACLSARANAGNDTDVMLVTNIEIQEPYYSLLNSNGVIIKQCPFDCFNFGASYTWSLAFYKLCAMYHISRECDYDFLCYLDADVYVQGTFEYVWQEAKQHIMLFDLGHGLHIKQYSNVMAETHEFLCNDINITQYGGEFVAAAREDAILLSDVCLSIYKEMLDRNITTKQGDEFILSIAASRLKEKIKHAGAYTFRFHTGEFRISPARYKFNPVSVLHVPNEKEIGFLKIFKYYEKHGKCPDNKVVWRWLHLVHPSFKTVCRLIKRKITSKNK